MNAALRQKFETALPRIETHADIYFRFQRENHGHYDDCIAETVAICWAWFVRLDARGKDPMQFVSAIVTFAARQVRGGRKVCGGKLAGEVTAKLCQQTNRFAVGELSEALVDNTQTPVPDQVAFRIDFPAWHSSHNRRDRRIIRELANGERTCVVASKFGLSNARISQLRSELRQSWELFGEQ